MTYRRKIDDHPLNQKELSTLFSQGAWKQTWEEEMSREEPRAEILIGLLHFIFEENIAREKVICFLLDVADGYQETSSFGEPEHRRVPLSDFPRSRVAEKAWAVLCDNLFRNTAEERSRFPSWARMVASEAAIQKLIWFFDPERGNIPESYRRDARAEIARQFIREFAEFAWRFRTLNRSDRAPTSEEENIQKVFFAVRPQLVEILAAVGGLGMFVKCGFMSYEFETDEQTLKKLEEITLQEKGLGEKPATIEEAVYLGRAAAQVFLICQTAAKERERQNAIAEAERQAEEAKRRLAELSGEESRSGGGGGN